jgi:hypothetical protein
MVVVAGSPKEPLVIDRRTIMIADPNWVQPYHRAEEMGIAQARVYLDRCTAASQAMALVELKEAYREHRPVACGMLMSSARALGTLEQTLASHAAIHSAEGEFFRDAIAYAAAACKLPCRKIREKELMTVAALTFGISDLDQRLAEMRKTLGSPWTQDEKYAALAGWLALA